MHNSIEPISENNFQYATGALLNSKTIVTIIPLEEVAYIIVSSPIPEAFNDFNVDGNNIKFNSIYDLNSDTKNQHSVVKLMLRKALKLNTLVGKIKPVRVDYPYDLSKAYMHGFAVKIKQQNGVKTVTRHLKTIIARFIPGSECKSKHYQEVIYEHYFVNDATFCIELSPDNKLETDGYMGAPVSDANGSLIGLIYFEAIGKPHIVYAIAKSLDFLNRREGKFKLCGRKS